MYCVDVTVQFFNGTAQGLVRQYSVNESEGSVSVCIQLEGTARKGLLLTITALNETAFGKICF